MNDKKLPFNPNLKDVAKKLRKAGNLSEVLLWQQLKNKQLGVTFNRQKIIGGYIADFYCAAIKTVIEIDGETHNYKGDYDNERNKYLQGLGLTVLHISNKEAKNNLEGVISALKEHIRQLNL